MIEAARIIAGLLADTQDIADEDQIARVILDALDAAGFAIVPKVPTRQMLNAAIDVDSYKLGDIGPLGFRCSPQQLFERCWQAMLTAAGVKP